VSALATFPEAGQQAPPAESHRLSPPAWQPSPPRRIEDLGIPEGLVFDIALRHVNHRGVCSIHQLAGLMKVSLEVAEPIFRHLNEHQQLEIRRMVGDDYVFSLSPNGRKIALERSLTSRYIGPLPVSLHAWTEAVRKQVTPIEVTRDSLRRAFHDIVVTDELLDGLGPALISQSPIFLYGPSGTGKTTVSERLRRVFADAIVVPFAVEVDGQIIAIADPAVHEPVSFPRLDIDPRWSTCSRPFVAVGGELTVNMLDLQRDDATGIYSSPLQMKANNGIMLIDDFGRQAMSPRDLLNRWIVPLDRRIDFLSLGSAGKFDVPFELLVVFSTNLAPQELADEAFLRRIPNKIVVKPVEAAAFDTIFGRVATKMNFQFGPDIPAQLRELCLRHSPDLRACFPRDICALLRAIHIYEGSALTITRKDLERAVTGYFL